MRLGTAKDDFYEVHPRKDKRGVDLISDVLPFRWLWYTKPDDAVGYAKFRSRSHDAVIRVYEEAGKVIETTRATSRSRSALVLRSSTDCWPRFVAQLCLVQAGCSPSGFAPPALSRLR
jgi:hypothetical protein